jgi:hypothetical protein
MSQYHIHLRNRQIKNNTVAVIMVSTTYESPIQDAFVYTLRDTLYACGVSVIASYQATVVVQYGFVFKPSKTQSARKSLSDPFVYLGSHRRTPTWGNHIRATSR